MKSLSEIDKEMRKSLEEFFAKGTIHSYEAGIEQPDAFQDRPFLEVIAELASSGRLSITNAKGASSTGHYEISSELPKTQYSKFIDKMESRFGDIMENSMIIVLDPDIIKNRYLTRGEDQNALVLKQFSEKLSKAAKNDTDKNVRVSSNDMYDIKTALMDADFPYAFSKPVKKGSKRRLNIIVPGNPDTSVQRKMNKMIDDCGVLKTDLPITRKQFQQAILYHEVAHAIDPRITEEPKEGQSPVPFRHREEALADIFAVLQMCKDEGNTDFGKCFSDIRAVMMASQVKGAVENNVSAVNVLPYYTSPVIDVAVETADKKLTDGSLKKMSDKEVFELAVSIVDKNSVPEKDFEKIAAGFNEKEPNDVYAAYKKRYSKAKNNIFDNLGKKAEEEKGSYSPSSIWQMNLSQRFLQVDDNETKRIEFVNKEKDRLRDERFTGVKGAGDVLDSYLRFPDDMIAQAKSYSDMKNRIASMKFDKENLSEDKAFEEFIKIENRKFENITDIDKSLSKKGFTEAEKSFKELMSNEAVSQSLAKKLRSDRKMWKQIKQSPYMARLVNTKAKGRQPMWMSETARSVEEKISGSLFIRDTIEEDKKQLDMAVDKIKAKTIQNVLQIKTASKTR